MPTIGSRLRSGWNAFRNNKDPAQEFEFGGAYSSDRYMNYGTGSSYRPDKNRLRMVNEKTIVSSIYNRIALDCASINVFHIRKDENDRFKEVIKSDLNLCLTLDANVDQTGRDLIKDAVLSMFDEGCVAIVPIDTTDDPTETGSYDISNMRVGKVKQWKSQHVLIDVYNEISGKKEEIQLPKRSVAIVENPLYSVMNEPNSTVNRLNRKLALMDTIDEKQGSDKIDILIQLPYVIKSESLRVRAEQRRKEIEDQMANSKYGVAYIDGTEHVTQLNRSVESNLMPQVEYYTKLLYSQLGLTDEIMNGTASEEAMLNYYNRTIEPIMTALTEEMSRKFLTKTARTQGQTIAYFRDPFKLISVNSVAEIADKMTRNEIMTSNEIRAIIGMKPSTDPQADELRNKNLNEAKPGDGTDAAVDPTGGVLDPAYEMQNIDDLDNQLDELEYTLKHEFESEDDELLHYASEYYDPEYAHAYYEAHKKLKGRKSTSNLNDKGKAAASYVKTQLDAERDQKIQDHSDQTNSAVDKNSEQRDQQIESNTEQMKQQVEQHKVQTQAQIDQIRQRLNNMSPNLKSALRSAYQTRIDALRAKNDEVRATLQAENKKLNADARESTKQANNELKEGHKTYTKETKEEYDNKYLDEMDKIHADKSMAKSSGKKSTSKSTGSSWEHKKVTVRKDLLVDPRKNKKK